LRLPALRENAYDFPIMTDIPRYHINVFWFEDEACWIADVPDLRPCSAQGAGPEEAVAKVRAAIEQWIAAAKSADLIIPEPRYSPAIYASRAG
jgi:predicted RNase H-like HicB family nuclease